MLRMFPQKLPKLSATPFAIKVYVIGLPVIAAKARAEFKVNGCFCFGLIWCIEQDHGLQ
ncbi:hypothetical protein [Pseudopedobacter beijingensis]|uniref:Uncharacterized protein n=1 Tax=Pseudopedobacter beijingensis TaxID=1207056 RepID=A0ABW4IDD3_9SPHI